MALDPDSPVVTANPDTVFAEHKDTWYATSSAYWARQEPTVNGMLGGYRQLTGVDVLMSCDIISKYQSAKARLGNGAVADCGCGIGRVAHFVLTDYFKEIDLIDPVERFLSVAVETLSGDSATVRTFHCGVQDWIPPRRYDAFWIQWAVMYLTDADAIAFLARCKANLNRNGLIFVKDNLAADDKATKREAAQFFVEDRGICRAYTHYMELFRNAGLALVEEVKQDQWPEDMLPLYCFVLK
jgi:protein N-terminal methyltransferase